MSNIFENKGALAVTILVAASNSLNRAAANYVCDGAADNIEIQAALDALPATGGKVLFLDGTYTISATIKIPDYAVLSGLEESFASYGNTKILVTAGYNANVIEKKSGGTATGIHITNLTIDMAGSVGGDAIHLDPCGYSSVSRCKIAAPAGVCIHICGGDTTVIDDCKLYGGTGVDKFNNYTFIRNSEFIGGQYGIYNSDSGPSVLLINGCSFESQASASIYLRRSSLGASGDTSITHCVFCKGTGNGIQLRYIRGVTITGCVIGCIATASYAIGKHGIYAEEQCQYITITGNVIRNVGNQANNTYDGIYGAFLESVISSNVIEAGTTAKMRNGIFVELGTNVQIIGNYVANALTNGIRLADSTNCFVEGNRAVNCATAYYPTVAVSGNRMTEQYVDLFMDVLAVSATHVRSNQDLSTGIPITFTIDAQPDVPRTLSGHFDTHAQITAYTIVITGVDAKGITVTETFTEAVSPWDFETVNAYATITSIKMTARTGTGALDTMDVGITDVLGLSNKIYVTSDVYKIKKNAANALVAVAQVNATYDTYDMVVIGLAVGDDFTIWFRSNLNIVA